MVRALYVGGDEVLASSLASMLAKEGCALDVARAGVDALQRCERERYAVVLLDWSIAGELDDLALCRVLHERGYSGAIILMPGHPSGRDARGSPRLGSAEIAALVARIDLAMGRSEPSSVVVHLDHARQVLVLVDEEVELTRTEYRLLSVLDHARGEGVSAEEICHAIWQRAREHERNNLHVTISKLRGKLGVEHQWCLETTDGGYRLVVRPGCVRASVGVARAR